MRKEAGELVGSSASSVPTTEGMEAAEVPGGGGRLAHQQLALISIVSPGGMDAGSMSDGRGGKQVGDFHQVVLMGARLLAGVWLTRQKPVPGPWASF